MPILNTIPLSKIKVNDQARKHFDEAELKALGENIREHGLLVPLLVKKSGDGFDLVAGERRLRGMKLVGMAECQALVVADMDAAQTEVVQWIENAHRSDLQPFEKAVALKGIKEKKGWNNKELAQHLHVDGSLPGKYLSVFDTIPAVQEAARAGKIGVSAWYSVSLVAAGEQAALLDMHMAGLPRDQIAELSKKKRTPVRDAVKVARVRCPLSTGTVVTVQGPEMSLEELIEALASTLESARKANRESIDVKTWARVMADKAKVAG